MTEDFIRKIARIETKVETLETKVSQEHNEQENYRDVVHKRFATVHNRLNAKDAKDAEDNKRVEMRINDLSHVYQHQDEALKEFKNFIIEAKKTFKTMNDFMSGQTAKENLWNQLIIGTIKMTGFTATVIGIIKYLEK